MLQDQLCQLLNPMKNLWLNLVLLQSKVFHLQIVFNENDADSSFMKKEPEATGKSS